MRSLSLPYRAANPRSVRGARRRGWVTLKPKSNYVETASWLGLNIWCERNCSGYWVSSFQCREFAFERSVDATAFGLRWT